MTDRELMQMALDALMRLEQDTFHPAKVFPYKPTMIAIRARLAQPEPEPVAWTTDIEFDYDTEVIPAYKKGKIGTSNIDIPLYTKQPQQTEQKPIAWRWKDVDDYETIMSVKPPHDEAEPLYTAPPQREWQGMTDKEILADDVLRYHFGLNGGAGPVSKKGKAIIEAINAKLKEKNHG